MARHPLTERIAAARQSLAELDVRRRQRNAELDRTLSALEERFAARTVERDQARGRLAPLSEANRTLAALADRLAALAERYAGAEDAATERLAGLLGAEPSGGAPGRFEDVGAEELEFEERAASF